MATSTVPPSAPVAGPVIWITGLPGSGKTTISTSLCRLLRERAIPVVLLDGDDFREAMGNDLGYGQADRLLNARRLGAFCRLLSAQGVHVVCATVSMFRECHEWNRQHLPRYVEVLVRTRHDLRLARDRKGIISAAAAQQLRDVVGADQSFEEPAAPHLVIENDEDGTVSASARRILELLETSS